MQCVQTASFGFARVAKFSMSEFSSSETISVRNSIAFGKSTSQRIYTEQHVPKIGWKLHKYGLKHALHTLDGHFR